MEKVSIVGIDITKNTFHAHDAGSSGSFVFRKELTRGNILSFLSGLDQCVVAMEACASAHH